MIPVVVEVALIGVCIYAIVMLVRSIVVVPEGHVAFVERLGRFHKQLDPGTYALIPFLDVLKSVSWSRKEEDDNRVVRVARYNMQFIPTMNQSYDLPPYTGLTMDKHKVSVNMILEFRIANPRKAVYHCTNLYSIMDKTFETKVRTYIASNSYADVFRHGNQLTDSVLASLNISEEAWGVTINNVRIQSITVPPEIIKLQTDRIVEEKQAEIRLQKLEQDRQFNEMKHRMDSEAIERERILSARQAQLKQDAQLALEHSVKEHQIKLAKMENDAQRAQQQTAIDMQMNRLAAIKLLGSTDEFLLEVMRIEAHRAVAESPHSKIILPVSGINALGLQQMLNAITSQST